jgi:hypothetical protein
MLNSVPESMRACLIEAAKLAGPAFKRKAAEQQQQAAAAPGGAAAAVGPLSFNISVDAGRAPPINAGGSAGAMVAFAAAPAPAATGAQRSGSMPATAESDPLITGLLAGALGSDPMLGPLSSLAAGPSMQRGGQPADGEQQQAGQQRQGGSDPQQLLDLIRWAGWCAQAVRAALLLLGWASPKVHSFQTPIPTLPCVLTAAAGAWTAAQRSRVPSRPQRWAWLQQGTPHTLQQPHCTCRWQQQRWRRRSNRLPSRCSGRRWRWWWRQWLGRWGCSGRGRCSRRPPPPISRCAAWMLDQECHACRLPQGDSLWKARQ